MNRPWYKVDSMNIRVDRRSLLEIEVLRFL